MCVCVLFVCFFFPECMHVFYRVTGTDAYFAAYFFFFRKNTEMSVCVIFYLNDVQK